jgi:hypothetical protein
MSKKLTHWLVCAFFLLTSCGSQAPVAKTQAEPPGSSLTPTGASTITPTFVPTQLTPTLVPTQPTPTAVGTPIPTPVASDGAWIAFIGFDENIYLIRSDGTDFTQLTRDANAGSGSPGQEIGYRNLAWSPNGNLLAFTRSDGSGSLIQAYRMADQALIPILSGKEGSFNWLPDNRSIIFADIAFEPTVTRGALSGGLSIIDIYSKAITPYLRADPAIRFTGPVWAKKGDRVYFQIRPVSVPKNYAGEDIGISESPEEAYLKIAGVNDCDWSPDGTQLVCRQGNWDIQCSSIVVFSAAGEKLTTISTSNDCHHLGYPKWSPDGKMLAFGGDTNGPWEIYQVKPDGSSLSEVTKTGQTGPGGDSPLWSPDGKSLAYLSSGNLNRDVYIINPDGSGNRRITKFPMGIMSFEWQPLYASNGPSNTPTPPSQNINLADPESIVLGLSSSIKNGTVDAFKQIITDDFVMYGTGMAGGRDKMSRDEFLIELEERIKSKPTCVGYTVNSTNDLVMLWTKGWKPLWDFRGTATSNELTLSIFLNNGKTSVSAYFTPGSAILGSSNVKSHSCP